jgi:antitoxin StbD
MEYVRAARSVSITELKRSPSAVLDQAGSEPVAVLNHNRPAAYLLSPAIYEAMLERLNADLRQVILEGIESGPPIPDKVLYKELTARYTEPSISKSMRNTKPRRRPAS